MHQATAIIRHDAENKVKPPIVVKEENRRRLPMLRVVVKKNDDIVYFIRVADGQLVFRSWERRRRKRTGGTTPASRLNSCAGKLRPTN